MSLVSMNIVNTELSNFHFPLSSRCNILKADQSDSYETYLRPIRVRQSIVEHLQREKSNRLLGLRTFDL